MALFGKSRFDKKSIPDPESALKGRDRVIMNPGQHYVNGHALSAPFADNLEVIYLGMGCFWGAERLFWKLEGVWTTAVGYSGGFTPNPTYEEVCSGGTGHAEVVMVVFDPSVVSTESVLKLFWESHDPTQGMKQGNDLGTQYRSAVYTTSEPQREVAESSLSTYQQLLTEQQLGMVTTEIKAAGVFYYAEEYHQQYLAKNPGGYCGIGGTGVCMPPSLQQ